MMRSSVQVSLICMLSIGGAAGMVLAGNSANPISIVLSGNDQMRYDKQQLEVPAGATIRLTMKNIGRLPKSAMGHNFVLLHRGTNIQAFSMAGITSPQTDYISEDKKDLVLAKTKILGPREKETITFTAPLEPGDYPYVCTFPGHSVFMKGIMTVVDPTP